MKTRVIEINVIIHIKVENFSKKIIFIMVKNKLLKLDQYWSLLNIILDEDNLFFFFGKEKKKHLDDDNLCPLFVIFFSFFKKTAKWAKVPKCIKLSELLEREWETKGNKPDQIAIHLFPILISFQIWHVMFGWLGIDVVISTTIGWIMFCLDRQASCDFTDFVE